MSFEYHHLPFPALFKFVISFDIAQPQFHWPLQDLGLQSLVQEGRPLLHLNLCIQKDLHLVPSRYPTVYEACGKIKFSYKCHTRNIMLLRANTEIENWLAPRYMNYYNKLFWCCWLVKTSNFKVQYLKTWAEHLQGHLLQMILLWSLA